MVTVTATDLSNLLNLSGVSASILESHIDAAIDRINLRINGDIPNMSGTAGSKTVNLTSAERGAVLEVATTIYSVSKSSASSSSAYGIGGLNLSETNASAQGNNAINDSVEKVAGYLREVDVSTG